MKTRRKILIGIAVLCVFAVLLLLWGMPFLRTPPFPIPESASWVRYKSEGAGTIGPGFEEWTRFTVSPEDCLPAAAAILQDFRQEQPKWFAEHKFVIKRVEISEGTPAPKIQGPWWFSPDSIKSGTALYLEGPIGPSVWIDNEHGTVYQHMSD